MKKHGAGFQGRAAIAQMLKDHGVSLRDKHPGDNYEPAGELYISSQYIICECCYNSSMCYPIILQFDHAGVGKIDIRKH